MIVIAIIGILAAIAIPNFITYRKRAYNASANADVKNAYTAAQAYFTDYPTGTVTMAKLNSVAGFRSSSAVATDGGGTIGDLEITAFHARGSRTYTIDSVGAITNNN
jgi:type IV pilus assembly protein PilA